MRLSRLYTNQPKIFAPIAFHRGLNVVQGEIRRPEKRERDVHNLGKSLLVQVIDFCLVRKNDQGSFLIRHKERFKDFVFFLEIATHAGGYVTVRRTVESSSKVSFLSHDEPHQDFLDAAVDSWDHWEVAFNTAKTLLDGILGLTAVSPWSFRRAVAYSLRTQKDYDEPFKLAKYGGKHVDWKPFLAHILGLDAKLVRRTYEIADEIEHKAGEEKRLKAEFPGIAENLDQLRGLVDIKQRETRQLQQELERYNFNLADADINRELVDVLDRDIAELNERKYYLSANKKSIQDSLRVYAPFPLKKIEKLFAQAKVYFGDQIKKDFKDLETFNKAISEERDQYLEQELANIESELEQIDRKLRDQNARRSAALVTLKDKETFSKYKRLTQRLVDQRTEVAVLERQRDAVAKLQDTRRELRELIQERANVSEAVERSIEQESDRYGKIRVHVDDIVKRVIDRHANLYTSLNKEGNIEFRVDIVDNHGHGTSAGEGQSYGRLLCIAFDMAVLCAYVDDPYPHFMVHDGVLETLDDRKKLNLIEVIRDYSSMGTQHIITVIDSELPHHPDGTRYRFDDSDVVFRLHDEGESGRLFKMPSW